MADYEGRWQCPNCMTENHGLSDVCSGLDGQSGCGKARPDDVEFYLPGGTPPITDPVVTRAARSGPDWYCSHCTGANNDIDPQTGVKVTHCKHCGNERDATDSVHAVTTYGVGGAPSTAREAEEELRERKTKASPASTRQWVTSDRQESGHMTHADAVRTQGWKKITPLLLAIMAFIGIAISIWFFFFATTQKDLVVTAVSWKRNVQTEALREVTDSGWSAPSGARSVTTTRKVRSYERRQVGTEQKYRIVTDRVPSGTESYKCGTRNNGNGTFSDVMCTRTLYKNVSRSESYSEAVYKEFPIYGTWYEYKIDRWVHYNTHTASGSSHEVYWAKFQLGVDERESGRNESYSVTLRDSKNVEYKYVTTYDEWKTYEVGQNIQAEVTRSKSVKPVDRTTGNW